MPIESTWTVEQRQLYDNYWDDHLPPVMWHRIMGFEELLQILTPKEYNDDKEYMMPSRQNAVHMDVLKTYIARKQNNAL